MSVFAEFKKQWVYHIVMALSLGTKFLVNYVEPAFARSLVSCDVPMGEEHTGSGSCGDRLLVINEGMKISTRGQSHENLAMLVAVTCAAVCCDAFGRRPALFIGISATAVSVVCFLSATRSPALAGLLFTVGQGAQGLYPGDFLNALMSADVSQMPTTNAAVFAQVQTLIGVVFGAMWFVLGNGIQIMELTDFTYIWAVVGFFNIITLVLAFWHMPETRPAQKDEDKVVTAKQMMWREVQMYQALLAKPITKRFLFVHFTRVFEGTSVFLISIQIMAYHNWSQKDVLFSFIPLCVATLLSNILVKQVSNSLGIMRTYLFGMLGHFIVGLPERFYIVVNPHAWMWIAAFRGLFNGREVYTGLMDQWLYEAHENARVNNLLFLTGYAAGFLAFPFYSWTFDAKSVTYLEKVTPNVIVIGIELVKLIGFFTLLWSMDGGKGGYRAMIAQADWLHGQVKAKCDDMFQAVTGGAGPLTDEAARQAGFVDTFKDWIDPSVLEGPFVFKTKDELFGAVRNFYDGKRLVEGEKVLQAASNMHASVLKSHGISAGPSDAATKTGVSKKAD